MIITWIVDFPLKFLKKKKNNTISYNNRRGRDRDANKKKATQFSENEMRLQSKEKKAQQLKDGNIARTALDCT